MFQYLIGFDCEFTSDNRPKVALMQLATEEKVYLLDFINLVDTIPLEKMQYFADEILAADISTNQILAYEPRNDFKALSNTTKVFQKLGDYKSFNNMLDMKVMSEELMSNSIVKLRNSKERGLAGLTDRVLGMVLDLAINNSNFWSKLETDAKKVTGQKLG